MGTIEEYKAKETNNTYYKIKDFGMEGEIDGLSIQDLRDILIEIEGVLFNRSIDSGEIKEPIPMDL